MKKKFNYKQFDIGDWVKVKKVLYIFRTWNNERKKIDIPGKIKPKLGRITGVKYLREGSIVYDFDYSYFEHKNTITCWEIRTGLTNRPIYALPEDIELCTLSDIAFLDFPVVERKSNQWKGPHAEEVKKDISESSKLWPRDEKGRWLKGY